MVNYKGTSKAEETGEAEQHDAAPVDAFAAIRAKFPVLRNLTKETFVNYTSLLGAYSHAVESKRPDSILNDPFAEALAGEAGKALMGFFPGMLDDPDGRFYGNFRHRVIDDALRTNLHPNVHQIVFLGAGMDSRCFRIEQLKACHAFEIDSSQELTVHKKHVLEELKATPFPEAYDQIVEDLAEYKWPDALEAHGFDPKVPTMWVLEGLLMHLDEAGVNRLLTTIDKISAPNSQLLCDMCGTGAINIDVSMDADRELTLSLDTTQKQHQGGILRALPWEVEILFQRSAEAEYSGSRWDAAAFGHVAVSKEKASYGPLAITLCTKPESKADDETVSAP